jgi:hypothetical protein
MEDSIISLPNLTRFFQNLEEEVVKKEDGKGLSSNDFTDLHKDMLEADYERLNYHLIDWNNPHKITPAKIGAAPVNHGNHVPNLELSQPNRFLGNDNTWRTILPSTIGASGVEHKHDGTDIITGRISLTHLPTSVVNNRILAVEFAHMSPVWTQINNEMMDVNSVNTIQLIDLSVTQNKLANFPIIDTNRLVDFSVTNVKIADTAVTNVKISDNTITGIKLNTSYNPDRVMAVRESNATPEWQKINTAMLNNSSVTTDKIADDSVTQIKLSNSQIIDTARLVNLSVTNAKIADNSITNAKIADLNITTNKLVDNIITSIKIVNKAIDGTKLFTSATSNRVLSVINAYDDPEYSEVTNSMIQNGTITGSKISPNIALPGTPTITTRPPLLSNNTEVPDTAWVTTKISNLIQTLVLDPGVLESFLNSLPTI